MVRTWLSTAKTREADRAFFRDILGFTSVDAGDGWLIFGLPAAESAFHSAEANDRHELSSTNIAFDGANI
jgi:hypothetical protein